MKRLRLDCRFLLRGLATLTLTFLLYSPSANPESAPPTIYWVASLLVSVKSYDKDEFRAKLLNFFGDVQRETARHSMMGGTDTKQCYSAEGRKVPHCEVVDIAWDPQMRKLTLSIEESEDQVGVVDHHECTANDSFEACFEHHRKYMAAKVGIHDSICHQQGKKCKINENNEFEPLVN